MTRNANDTMSLILHVQKEQLVEGPPEMFFALLEDHAKHLLKATLEITLIARGLNQDMQDHAKQTRTTAVSMVRDILLFIARSRGLNQDCEQGYVDMTLDRSFHNGAIYLGMGRYKLDPILALPEDLRLCQLRGQSFDIDPTPIKEPYLGTRLTELVSDIDITDTYPKTQEVPLEVALELGYGYDMTTGKLIEPEEAARLAVGLKAVVEKGEVAMDIMNNDVAKSYPKSDCLPTGFADDVIAKGGNGHQAATATAERYCQQVFEERRKSLGDDSGHPGNNLEPGLISKAMSRSDSNE